MCAEKHFVDETLNLVGPFFPVTSLLVLWGFCFENAVVLYITLICLPRLAYLIIFCWLLNLFLVKTNDAFPNNGSHLKIVIETPASFILRTKSFKVSLSQRRFVVLLLIRC